MHMYVQFISKTLGTCETLNGRNITRGVCRPSVADTIRAARAAVAFPPLTVTELPGGAEQSTSTAHTVTAHCLKNCLV